MQSLVVWNGISHSCLNLLTFLKILLMAMPDDIDPPTWLNLLPVLQTYLMTDRIDPQSFQIGSFGVIVGLSQVELR